MIFYVEQENDAALPLDAEAVGRAVAAAVLQDMGCPFEAAICLMLTDDEGIRSLNRMHRGKDAVTDVLSFPALAFPAPAAFDTLDLTLPGVTDPETGAVWLGDIAVNTGRVRTQAESYGHALTREFAFLVAHSVLHLLGFDHETPDEASDMERRQEAVLDKLMFTRDMKDDA